MDHRIERTKRNIYNAFFELLKKKTMDEITVTELAALADINRRTFYTHYATVTDVWLEFKQLFQDRLTALLEECETRGKGEVPDFVYFYQQLQDIMLENRPLYEKMSKEYAMMFLRFDCNEILEDALSEFYGDRFPGTQIEKEVYISFLSNAVTGLGPDYLTRKPDMSYEEYCRASVPLLEKIWKPRT